MLDVLALVAVRDACWRRVHFALNAGILAGGADRRRPVERSRNAHVEHASAEDQDGPVEPKVSDEMLNEDGEHKASGRCSGDADAIRQRPTLVEVHRDDDDARGRRQSAANAWRGDGWTSRLSAWKAILLRTSQNSEREEQVIEGGRERAQGQPEGAEQAAQKDDRPTGEALAQRARERR